jgi:AbrB family looped-hinge helix DNA binding protein
MSVQVRVDRQGRVVIPLHERKRLGITNGGTLALTPTLEGVFLEPHTPAKVRIAGSRNPNLGQVSNEEALHAINREREHE